MMIQVAGFEVQISRKSRETADRAAQAARGRRIAEAVAEARRQARQKFLLGL